MNKLVRLEILIYYILHVSLKNIVNIKFKFNFYLIFFYDMINIEVN